MPTNSKEAFDLEQALQECSQEPIHIPGSIQPMGFLLLYDLKNDKILAVSQNITEYNGKSTSHILESPLNTALGRRAAVELKSNLHSDKYEENNDVGYKRMYKLTLYKEEFVVFVNGPAHQILIEIEPLDKTQVFSFFDFASNIQERLRWMFAPYEMPVEQVFDLAMEELKGITGFDRVMLYKFDSDYSGQVISEALGEMESFLGLYFPSTDIPEQARALYLKNWIRLISDVDYDPVPLLTKDVNQPPIDLTYSSFRSVSPVHLQYLRNMGVGASMSISLVVDGRLWGLIVMHHPQPLEISPDKRAAALYTGQLLTMNIGRDERRQIEERQTDLKTLERDILSLLVEDASNFYDALEDNKKTLMKLCKANGLLLLHNDTIRLSVGVHGVIENVGRFGEWLKENIGDKLYYHCDRLPQDDPILDFLMPPLPGILAVPFLSVSSYLIWFRFERGQNIKWGGNPQKKIEKNLKGAFSLSPRKSFKTWEEKVSGNAMPWSPIDQEMALAIGKWLALLQMRYRERKKESPIVGELRLLDEYRFRDEERKANILNEQFRVMVESSPDALAALDNNNRFIILNPTYQEMFHNRFGIKPQIGDRLVDLLRHSPKVLKKSLHFWEQVRQGKITNEESSYQDKNGTDIYTFNTYKNIYDENGNLQAVLSTSRDITRTKASEREVKELYQKYKLLVHSVGPLTWTANGEGAFDYPQSAWEAFTGQDFKDYEGYGWLEAIHEDDREYVEKHWLYCIKSKLVYETDVRIWNVKEGSFEHFVVYAIPILSETEEVQEWFGLCISIRRLKEQEAKLESAMKALQTSNEDLQHFAHVASHDLQEPLRMITGYLSLIEKRYNDVLDDRGREFIHYAVDGAYRMKRLIEELLVYSRINRRDKYENVALDIVFGHILQNFNLKIIEKKARIHSPTLPEIRGIPVQMHQLFTNLLSNALKFSEDGIIPEIRISVESRKLSWQFTFEDNGIGIDPKYAKKAFHVFFRLKSKQKYPGTGMGLAICKRVVNNHGGKIWIDTDYKDGSRFIFTIRKYLENENA